MSSLYLLPILIERSPLTHVVIVFLLSVLLQSSQVLLAQRLLLDQEVKHVGGERLLPSPIGKVHGENILKVVLIGLKCQFVKR